MKNWKGKQAFLQQGLAIPEKQPILEEVTVKKDLIFQLECLECSGLGAVLFQGTSYCRKCVTEKLRRGR